MKKKTRMLAAVLLAFSMLLCSCSSCSKLQDIIKAVKGDDESTASTKETSGSADNSETEESGTEESGTEESGSGEEDTKTASKTEKDESEKPTKETKGPKDHSDESGMSGGEKETSSEESSESSSESSSETESSTEAHKHTFNHILKKDPTCETNGNIEYWQCTECGRCYKDSAGKEYIEKPENLVLLALGHDLLFSKGYTPTPLTCMTEGTRGKFTCQRCGRVFLDEECKNEVKSESDLKYYGAHTLVHVAKVDAGCETAGNTEYWECSVCGKLFSDAEAKTEIASPTYVVLYPLGHDYGTLIEAMPGCETEGWIAHYHCSRCGHYFDDKYTDKGTDPTPFYIAPLGHYLSHYADDVDCVDGYHEHYECSICHQWFALDQTTKKNKEDFFFYGNGLHDYQIVYDGEGKKIYHSDGKRYLFRCTKCGEEIYMDPKG